MASAQSPRATKHDRASRFPPFAGAEIWFIIERDQMFTENANKAINPGLITLENLKPYSKNPIIANFFHQIGRADELGSGVRNLYHYVKLYSGADPVFDEKDVFRLTVPLNPDYSPEKGLVRTTEKTTEKTAEERLRKLLSDSPSMTMTELAAKLQMTEDGVYYHINRLKKSGMLKRIGGRKSGRWVFASNAVDERQ